MDSIKSSNLESIVNYGNELQFQGKVKEAIGCYSKALLISPNHPAILLNLGAGLYSLGRLEEAEKILKKALKIPFNSTCTAYCYYNLGMIRLQERKLSQAIAFLNKAAELDSSFTDAVNNLFLVKRQICDWRGIKKIEKKLDELEYNGPLTSIIRYEDPEKNFKTARIWSQNLQRSIGKTPYAFSKEGRIKKKKIRIGYLSSDLQNHPVGQMVSGMMNYHDKNKFETFIYSFGKDDGTVFRKMIKNGADNFFDIRNISDFQTADIIFAHGIDILVDLMGPTKDSRLEICARRPAPIQATWLGFPGTTGADFFDYMIVDKIVVPPEHAKFYNEKLIYLPRCYQVNNNLIKASKKKFKKGDFGLPENGIVFASFNQPYKIDPVIWAVWMSILKSVPDSVLWLWEKDSEVVANLRMEAKNAGINSKRLVFSKKLPKEEHLSRIALADLGLDTRIYGGHTTTSDFLWAGVPVITKKGNHFASRVCASILSEAKLPELICNSLKEYENKAVDLALNPTKLIKLKQKITHEKLEKNLFDTQSFVRDLEKAYGEMWKNYRKSK